VKIINFLTHHHIAHESFLMYSLLLELILPVFLILILAICKLAERELIPACFEIIDTLSYRKRLYIGDFFSQVRRRDNQMEVILH